MRTFIERFGRRRHVKVASIGFAGLLSTGLVVGWPFDGAHARRDRGPTAIVRQAPFTETLVERGTIGAARMMLYGSTIAGTQAKILELAPEGAPVNEGDVLVRFDPAPFEQNVARETAALAQAEAEALRTSEDLRLEEMRARADVESARESIGFAETALVNERDGRGPLALAEADAAASDAARQWEQARTTFEDTRALLKDGFVTRVEVDRAEQTLQQAADRQRVAALRLASVRTFEHPAAVSKARAEVQSARQGLARAGETASARLAQRRAIVALAVSRVDEATQRLANARNQVARTVLRSTAAGLVVHCELFFGTEKRKPQPGDEVWPNQSIVAVPDAGQLLVHTRVREIDLHKVSSSQRVFVAVDAYPGVRLPASVSVIGALAQEDPGRAGVKFFPITVKLRTHDPRLRTGMTARVEIEVSSIPQATVVPLQAIVDDGGASVCYVVTRGGIAPVTVDVAARNEVVAAIRSGVAPGDTVLIIDPTDPATGREGRQ